MYMDNVLENFNFIGISIGILVFLLIILLAKGYRKASPDKAFIISGPKKEPRALIGRSGFMIPFVERMDSLYLKQVTVEVNTPGPVPTKDLINVNVEAVFKIQICTDVAGGKFARAMINFLNKDPQQIIDDTRDSLQGNLREIIGTMNLADLIREKDKLADAILNAAGRDMDALGLQIVTCNILKFTDQSGAIDDMGDGTPGYLGYIPWNQFTSDDPTQPLPSLIEFAILKTIGSSEVLNIIIYSMTPDFTKVVAQILYSQKVQFLGDAFPVFDGSTCNSYTSPICTADYVINNSIPPNWMVMQHPINTQIVNKISIDSCSNTNSSNPIPFSLVLSRAGSADFSNIIRQ